MTQGKRKFERQPVTAEHCRNNQLVLQLAMFEAERYWADGMEKKQQRTEAEKNDESNRHKFQARKKFKKAQQAAERLVAIVKELEMDPNTQFEAEAYLATISAAL